MDRPCFRRCCCVSVITKNRLAGGFSRLMTKWHLCVAFSKIYKDEVALASLREGGGPPQVVEGAREHPKQLFHRKWLLHLPLAPSVSHAADSSLPEGAHVPPIGFAANSMFVQFAKGFFGYGVCQQSAVRENSHEVFWHPQRESELKRASGAE